MIGWWQPLPFHVSEARQSLQEREKHEFDFIKKGENWNVTTRWFCENLPLWEGFIVDWARRMVELGWNHYQYSKTSMQQTCMDAPFFTKTSFFGNICCWPGRVHCVHGGISCNGHASTFCHTHSSWRCHCCSRHDGSVEEEVGVPGVLMEWRGWIGVWINGVRVKGSLFSDFKGCMFFFGRFASGNSFLDRVWECPSPTNNRSVFSSLLVTGMYRPQAKYIGPYQATSWSKWFTPWTVNHGCFLLQKHPIQTQFLHIWKIRLWGGNLKPMSFPRESTIFLRDFEGVPIFGMSAWRSSCTQLLTCKQRALMVLLDAGRETWWCYFLHEKWGCWWSP